jgi:cation-transporting ATPase E
MTVGYIGDGSNDALALRYADVGIAMRNATIATKSASDMVLMDDSLKGVL